MAIEALYGFFKEFPTVCTDSRKIEKDVLFFALKGENFDGNKFAREALKQGAAYAIVDDATIENNERILVVEDVLSTMQELARHHRSQLDIPVIGLTGSNGKTTTKELVHAVLNQKYNCLATIGNLNNHIGVPLTLLKLTKDHEMAIIEMGANHVGEIGILCEIAVPNYGLITNIGRAHIGEFGGYENIIKTKKELYDSIRESNGQLFVNGNDDLLMKGSMDIDRATYGKASNNQTIGSYHSQNPFLNVHWQSEDVLIKTQLIGKYNTDNVLAAVAIGEYFNVSQNQIVKALEDYAPSNNRSQIKKTERNTLIMDAYNANPSSVEVAIENLVAMNSEKKFFILGDMLELGDESEKEHLGIYNLIQENKLNGIFIGPEFGKIFKEREGLSSYNSTTEAQEEMSKLDFSDLLILLKGSRGMKLETLCPLL